MNGTQIVDVRLSELERTIERGLTTFIEVGHALMEIRDNRLYRTTHGTFEDYCRERWGFTDRRARMLIDAAEVVGELRIGTTVPVLPASERQARPLAALPSEERAAAWQQAVETAPNGKVTAAHVETVARQYTTPSAPAHEWTRSEEMRRGLVEAGRTVHANMKSDWALVAWAKEAGLFVRVDRASEWGNPFHLPGDGDRGTVVENYRWYLERKPSLIEAIPTLRGKVLGCWCYPELCHGRILEEWANGNDTH